MDTVEQSNDLVIEKNNDKSNDNYQKLVEWNLLYTWI
jgi:hypothetical protein